MPEEETAAEILAIARRQKDRMNREVELLVAIAAEPRRAIDVLREMKVTRGDFLEVDTATLFHVIEKAGEVAGTPLTKLQILRMAREALRHVHCWDEHDNRPFAVGMIWGPGPLMRLLSCCDYDDHMLRRCISSLRNG